MGEYSGDWDIPDHDQDQTHNHQQPPAVPPAYTHHVSLPSSTSTSTSNPHPAIQNHQSLAYFWSSRLAALAKYAPMNRSRSYLVHSLLHSTKLLSHVSSYAPPPATIEDLRRYHSIEYLSVFNNPSRASSKTLSHYGLEDDAAPFPNLYEYCCYQAGGSLAAATALITKIANIAIFLDGGRHHARKEKAAGFCYINDCVLAILRLLDTYNRVLYIDIDVHHGDGVEEAFSGTDRVLTVSMHHTSPGFYPGTGGSGNLHGINKSNDVSTHSSHYQRSVVNLSLRQGLKDDVFVHAFERLVSSCMSIYSPDCIVLQCGVDGLSHDPIAKGVWSLTPVAFNRIGKIAKGWQVPLLVLGGGGYNSPAAACAWTQLLGGLVGVDVPEDVPVDDRFFEKYGPSFALNAVPGGRMVVRRDENTVEEVELLIEKEIENLRSKMAGGQEGAVDDKQGTKKQRKA